MVLTQCLLLQKASRDRGSQKLTIDLNKGFDEHQKKDAADMGMQALMGIKCTNLVNHVC